MNRIIKPQITPLSGDIEVGPDKSISHRAVILSALAEGTGTIKNCLLAADTLSTIGCMQKLGIRLEQQKNEIIIQGQGIQGFKPSDTVLECGNSGTTMRLMAGLLAGQNFTCTLSGDESLNRRPMKRVIEPLSLMGAKISGKNSFPPLTIEGGHLKGITYELPVASAQVKSALLLAGLNAVGSTIIMEPVKSRDHSERMLGSMGAAIKMEKGGINLKHGSELKPVDWVVPGDISSAAFFMVAASLIPGSCLRIRNVGLNPTRSGIITVLEKMNGHIEVENQHLNGGEPVGDIIISHAQLQGTTVEGDIIPLLVDEIPILAVAMALADGPSVVKNARELRFKETDRIAAISSQLSALGVDLEEFEDGFVINGRPDSLPGGIVDSLGDHRMAMSLAVAGLCGHKETTIKNAEAVNISFPEFWDILREVTS
jgi:3-phosphoshikimate 1-carboxyvinyltransferase